MEDQDKTALALKYPDFHTWRDLDAAIKNGGVWPSGELVRLSDPEMKPKMDELLDKVENDPEFAKQIIRKYTTPDDTV